MVPRTIYYYTQKLLKTCVIDFALSSAEKKISMTL